MKRFSRVMLGASLALCAASVFAQPPARSDDPSAPKTRAQVKADLRAWIAAGYDPNDWLNYPENALRVSRILAARQAQMGGGGTVQQ
jgi:hypothetical protein